jgi:ACS family glucarate transporter-like MFS transporter
MMFLTWLFMSPLGGLAVDRMVRLYGPHRGTRIIGIGGLCFSAVLTFAGANASAPFAAVGLMSLALGLSSWSDAAYWAELIGVSGENVGAAGGIMNSGGNLGGFVAPILTPFISSFAGWTWGLYFGALIAACGAAAWLFVRPAEKAVGVQVAS